MKKLVNLYILLLTAILSSCTRNDGDIGDWFGTWHLDKIEVDGSPSPTYDGDIFWQFQNTVFCMKKVTELHDYIPRWGTWAQPSPSILELDFTHHDSSHDEGSAFYSPFPETGIEPDAVSRLDIISFSSSSLSLEYVSPRGVIFRYYLSHW